MEDKPMKSKQVLPNAAETRKIGEMLRKSYDTLCNKAYESFKESSNNGEYTWRHENLKLEIASLLYFAYDFAMGTGKNIEMKNKFRDGFLEALLPRIDNVERKRINSRIEEYLNAIRSAHDDIVRQELLLGGVFAKHTGNAEDVFVATWAFLQYGATFRFVADLFEVDGEILNNTPVVNREVKIKKSNNISKEKNWINKNITISGLFMSYMTVLVMVLWLVFCFFITKFMTGYISEDMRNVLVLIIFLPGSFGIYKIMKRYFDRK